ncbi:MAG: hypothetical protein MJH13_09330 [Shewanella sp.]|nr:hypothetical protein [Shewanella sp.]MCJ8302909.1 hypothetical protein [Shewanella sp.]
MKCDRIYQEKRSGRAAVRPEFKACMNYFREGDTLIMLDQDIDTGTSTDIWRFYSSADYYHRIYWRRGGCSCPRVI